MQVLVGGDALKHLVGNRLVAGLAGVAVADARREFLEGHVGDRVQQAGVALVDGCAVTVCHVFHAEALELDGVDCARDDEVVTHHDAVAVLLGGPPADPRSPGTVLRKVLGDLTVVGRQVVLGEQVGDHRGASYLAEL